MSKMAAKKGENYDNSGFRGTEEVEEDVEEAEEEEEYEEEGGEKRGNNKKGAGRKPALKLFFQPSFVLSKTHCIKLLSKQRIPCLFPAYLPQWKKLMRKKAKEVFARFYLSLFSWHDPKTDLPHAGFTFADFVKFSDGLLRIPNGEIYPRFDHYCMLKCLWNIADSPKNLSSSDKQIVMKYRNAEKTLWCESKETKRGRDGRFRFDDNTIDPFVDIGSSALDVENFDKGGEGQVMTDENGRTMMNEKDLRELESVLRKEARQDEMSLNDVANDFMLKSMLRFLSSSLADGLGLNETVVPASNEQRSNTMAPLLPVADFMTDRELKGFKSDIANYDTDKLDRNFVNVGNITPSMQEDFKNGIMGDTNFPFDSRDQFAHLLDKSFDDVLIPGPIARQLRADQKVALKETMIVIDRLHYDNIYPEESFVVLGSAGSGKTFLIQALYEQCLVRGVGVISCAFTGSASTLLSNLDRHGRFSPSDTFNSTFNMSRNAAGSLSTDGRAKTQDLKRDKIEEMISGNWSVRTCVIVADELSMLQDLHILRMKDVLMQLSLVDAPFQVANNNNPGKYPFGRFLGLYLGKFYYFIIIVFIFRTKLYFLFCNIYFYY
jgi:hypothetical protein